MREELKKAVVEGLVLAGTLSLFGGITTWRKPEDYGYLEWMLPLTLGGLAAIGGAFLLKRWFAKRADAHSLSAFRAAGTVDK